MRCVTDTEVAPGIKDGVDVREEHGSSIPLAAADVDTQSGRERLASGGPREESFPRLSE